MANLIQSWASACSLETMARPIAVAETCRAPLPPGTVIYITALPGDTGADRIATAKRLRAAGFEPVPHLGARHLRGAAELDDLLARLAGEAGVTQVLAIGGDVATPAGTFAATLDLLRAAAFERHGIHQVGLAGYPEGHPSIPPNVLVSALSAKIAELRRRGIACHVVTQFCFDALPILAWLATFRERHPDIPVHVGLAGPARLSTLLRYAARCGIGASLGALRRRASMARLLVETGPDDIIERLARDGRAASAIAGLHIFTFGGMVTTTAWLRTLAAARVLADETAG